MERPRDLGPADTTTHAREVRPTPQQCGDSEVASRWANGQYPRGQKHRKRIGQIQKTCTHGGKERLPTLSRTSRTACDTSSRNTIRKPTIGPNCEPKDRENLSIDATHTEGDGSAKDNGKSGCGVVIKGVDRNKWNTITRIAPLKTGTAMEAEVSVCACSEKSLIWCSPSA